jgi:hypothetical protein
VRPLFTSASNTPYTIIRTLKTLMCVVLLIVFVDVISGPIAAFISNAPPHIDGTAQFVAGFLAFFRLKNADVKPIVFTGSSQMQVATSPTLFDQEIHTMTNQTVDSVNVSEVGANTTVTRSIIENLLIPNDIKTIIYGIELRALNKPSALYEDRYKTAEIGRILTLPQGMEQTLSLWLLEHSNLMRYRNNLQDWIRGDTFSVDFQGDDHGYLALNAHHPFQDLTNSDQFIPFNRVDALQTDLEAIAQLCHDKAIRCIVVNMPLREDLYKAIPQDSKTVYHDILTSIMSKWAIPLWDFNNDACQSVFTATNFADINHLNPEGSHMFTKAMATLYARHVLNIGQTTDDLGACAEISTP